MIEDKEADYLDKIPRSEGAQCSVARYAGPVIPGGCDPRVTFCRPEISGLVDADIHVDSLVSWRYQVGAS